MLSNAFRNSSALAAVLLAVSGVASAQDTIGGAVSSSPSRRGDFQVETVVVTGVRSGDVAQSIDSRTLTSHKVVDLAEILADELVEVQMIRKGGYGNEVSVRGFGQENVKVLVDGGILEGACGGRKDPSLSHIDMLTVQKLIVREGPFDVTIPNYLGGYVDVVTKKPKAGLEISALGRIGSYDFRSAGFTVNGGNDKVQGLIGYNFSESGQYEDGDGNKFWTVRQGFSAPYNDAGKAANSFRKHDVWGKLQITLDERNTILLEHAYGRANDILTPRAGADTEKEITNLSKASWETRDLGPMSKVLTVSFYRNEVGHYPYQKYRSVAVPTNNKVESVITGGGIQNVTEADYATFTYGIDVYQRDWRGDVYNSLTGVKTNDGFIPSVQTLDVGGYVQANKTYAAWELQAGLRYDRFEQEADETLKFSGSVTGANRRVDYLLGGNVSAKYFPIPDVTLFAGIGRNYRTPTSIERYIQSNATFFGNPELDPTANTEVDLGFRYASGRWLFQAKGFYSNLDDFIYQEKNSAGYKSYTNIDAHITGGDVTASVDLAYGFSLNGGVAYQVGRKDSFPDNNSDRDLGQISPLKGRLALNYNNDRPFGLADAGLFGTVEWVHSDAAEDVDLAVGEQQLTSWDIANLRLGYRFESWTLNFGIDNLFDRTYAVANSYEWDVVSGSGANPAIVNEPGRFVYASLAFSVGQGR